MKNFFKLLDDVLDDNRSSKKAYLFLSSEVPAWKAVAKAAQIKAEEALKQFVGPDIETKREKWTTGSKPYFKALRERLKEKSQIFQKTYGHKFPLEKFLNAVDQFYNDDVSVYEFANLIDLSMSDAERILDRYYFSENSFPQLLCYVPASNAQLDAARFGGIYHVLLERDDLVIDGRMRIRYHLGAMIRVKLNIRRYSFENIGKPYHEYDGFVKLDEPSGYGIFQERNNVKRPDFFHFNLGISRVVPTSDNPWWGLYLSSTKDEHPSPVSGRICIFRKDDNNLADKELAAFMHSPNENEKVNFENYLNREFSIKMPCSNASEKE